MVYLIALSLVLAVIALTLLLVVRQLMNRIALYQKYESLAENANKTVQDAKKLIEYQDEKLRVYKQLLNEKD